MSSSVEPPCGWTNNEAHLHKNYYWTNDRFSLKEVLETHYGLTDVSPVWARNPEYGGVLFIFEGKPNNKDKFYYVWNGYGDNVAQFEEASLQQIKDDIETFGGEKGYLGKIKFKSI